MISDLGDVHTTAIWIPPQGMFENAFLERVFPHSSEARQARKLSAARSYG